MALAARRAAFVALALALAAGLSGLLARALAPGGWTGWEVAILALYVATTPWTALSAANALLGLAVRLLARDPVAAVVPALRGARLDRPPGLRTAVVVPVRDEDMARVLPPLGRLLAGLAAAGAGDRFDLWVLSDTREPGRVAAEEAALAAFRASRGADGAARVRWRRRADSAGYKAGNVMAFLDAEGAAYDAAVCLDADSAMSAAAVLRLVACLEAEPGLAIAQALIAGRPPAAAFPRLYGFGMRAGMRAWATGQAWWQGPAGPYWGHNAAIRVAPFRAHARLAPLPDGSHVLSHDQVEAARLVAAGWAVRVLPDDEGSLEAAPPAMPEFLARDRRWGAGNMQYLAILRAHWPGLTGMGRWQLVQAILLFAIAPLWAALALLAVANAHAPGGGDATPGGALALALGATWLAYFSPKLAGYAEALLRPPLAARYGGRAAFARGAAAEAAFLALFEPVALLDKAFRLALLPFGRRERWRGQNREDRGVGWGEAARLLWPHTAFGLACAAGLASASWGASAWGLPFLAGPVLAVPLCVASADPRVSAWLRERRVAATPEELAGLAPT